ncbi:MAG: Na+/H+ antiporter subunit E [Bacteroidales bacterium]|nr:Na+/H+ antiporter subunit E [Bacteroidales bacterium]MCF8327279.1 Na+/H+ antiporter subunit E [Bacteroidales bacterium]
MRYVVYFIIILIFWLLITFSLSLSNIIVGAAVALLTTLLFGKYSLESNVKIIQPQRYFWFIVYLFIFLWEVIKANFDVAYRVIHPALPIKPGIVRVPLEIKSDIARTMLANSITMTPGTITMDIVGDEIFVHWIYVQSDNPEVYAEKVSGRFEKYIKKIFE